MAYMHIGKDFVPQDVPGKVTGRIKYSEDYARDGMVYARLLTSPVPHGRVVDIDASEALAMDGVIGILTADDVYPDGEPQSPGLKVLTNEPTLIGEPILAIAAVDEKTAEDAMMKISLTIERLPFALDPLDSLVEGGPDAYNGGNTFVFRQGFASEKWSSDQVAAFRSGSEPTAEAQQSWEYGDLAAGFAASDFVYETNFSTAGYPHMSMEPRSAMSYWENGKCYLHGTSQSLTAVAEGLAGIVGVPLEDFVFVNEATGGGFGQRARAGSIPILAVPAKLSQKINRPVMMRVTREEEFTIGGARQGLQGWIKVGFKADGAMAAMDMYCVSDNGGKGGGGDANSAAGGVSALYQTEAMRFRNTSIGTNTGHRGAQRGPGENQIMAVLAPIMDKAAEDLGLDRLEIRKLNAAQNGDVSGPRSQPFTSAYMPEALEMGAAQFDWETKRSRSRQTDGSKVRGLGIGQGYHNAGRSGMDGLIRMLPNGRLQIHNGVGNLGTYSYASTSRAAAEVLKMDWANCDVITGRTDRHLPISSPQDGSNSIFTNTRTCYGAAQDMLGKMKEIAAADLGGDVADYDIDGSRVFQMADTSVGMTYAEVATRGLELGGKYTGEAELPEELNVVTALAVERLAGSALMGVYHDPRHNNNPPGFTVTFMEIELDKETGKFDILDLVTIAECGTVVHPQGLANQLRGGAVWGIGLSAYERHLYDPQNGLPASSGYWQSKIPTYLDTPENIGTGWVDLPDPENPVGARGIGEPSMGAVSAALNAAISDALDGHLFNAAPVTADMIINHVAGISENSVPLAQNNFRG
ncbi:MAG: xanthine dehydrogenase family protein molybdopterin-binding subunit [Gammaproteobacteria bacterium]|jgi:CO/xanthine dehydrogenase Mo-binding subunit|nr:xanthine dehydrogenase family protein molybdopterin-binding subunit [Gammaproteobacteria bacterium]MBT3987429.1 xanthine dehydrogenase family protein molybdopterin-binding subunit [Gammaproteobacteria bacterium]MBT4255152.1 xanthine dehydrogenase family protein molybdopterin-binding subunit [Gammaproteobacteria bacterium]MBT4581833.1 xanthine dehydrogenase family protein molybdopterin-binding subunit [Gammaproteobacteria bacterium]MBT4659693.1 xanthine dehydrogenase family protein molybdopte